MLPWCEGERREKGKIKIFTAHKMTSRPSDLARLLDLKTQTYTIETNLIETLLKQDQLFSLVLSYFKFYILSSRLTTASRSSCSCMPAPTRVPIPSSTGPSAPTGPASSPTRTELRPEDDG